MTRARVRRLDEPDDETRALLERVERVPAMLSNEEAVEALRPLAALLLARRARNAADASARAGDDGALREAA